MLNKKVKTPGIEVPKMLDISNIWRALQ